MTRESGTLTKVVVFIAHALVGWALCFLTIGIAMWLAPEFVALVIHAALAPVIFFVVSLVYFRYFNYTGPLPTAIGFVLFVILMDFFLVAMVMLRSLEMFASFIGTWLPFALIFLSSWLTGEAVRRLGRA